MAFLPLRVASWHLERLALGTTIKAESKTSEFQVPHAPVLLTTRDHLSIFNKQVTPEAV